MLEKKIMKIRIFPKADYRNTKDWETNINYVLEELQLSGTPNQLTALVDMVYIMHEITVSTGDIV